MDFSVKDLVKVEIIGNYKIVITRKVSRYFWYIFNLKHKCIVHNEGDGSKGNSNFENAYNDARFNMPSDF
jgi:hypothetical protein